MNFSKFKIIYIILALALILGGGYLIWQHNINKHREQAPQPEAADMYEYREQSEQVSPAEGEQVSTDINEYQTYTNSKYNFSFQYPKGFTVTNFQEGEYGETILVRPSNEYQQVSTNIAGDSPQVSTNINKYPGNFSFQIFISPFDEPGPLTKERILEDVPDMVIENPEQRLLKNGVPGLIFFSQEASLGKTREVWFIHPVRSSDSNEVYNGYLYQISTLAELDKWLADILSTWKFQ